MKKVAIQGIAGSFHDIAAREYFRGEEIEIIERETFQDVFETVKNDPSIIAAVAIENTIAGSLLQNHTMLKESGLKIAGEQKIRIKHNLVAIANQDIADIHEVHSHPIALRQCESFLQKNRHIKVIESDDTASSAKRVMQEGKPGVAAICGELAAELYGLEILAKGIETNKRNFTRFLIVAEENLVQDLNKGKFPNKATLAFTLPHEEGSLAKVLSILSYYGLNLSKIQSFPIIGREWEYQFHVDLMFSNYTKYQQALFAVTPLLSALQIMGEYEEGRQTI